MSQKLKELIIYIAQKSVSDSHFGSIKLNKILFYSDMLAFGNGGKSITGAKYLKRPFGPAPENIKFTQREMEKDGLIRVETRPVLVGEQKRPIALREADLSEVSASEVKTVDFVMSWLKDSNAPETSALSHDFRWFAVEMKQEIPLTTVFLNPRPLTRKEVEYGLSLSAKAA